MSRMEYDRYGGRPGYDNTPRYEYIGEPSKKSVFFSGRTTKGVGRVNHPDH